MTATCTFDVSLTTGRTGLDPVFGGAADCGRELVEHRTLDGRVQELVHRAAPHA